ncbi:bile acid:sodium symporter family protein [Ekhidna sp.]|jgi:BASS family bile acid:Na+ symporter|uniref:bile acid:sodium symporter family protein n=1 Tax=Ekhidna sp. TaxID=2608089 RepID=UPI0032EB8DFF
MRETQDVLIPIAIAIIMWGIGLNLTFKSFKRVFVQPKAILTGLSLQLIMLPAIGFLIASVWDLDPAYKVGIVLIAACPGGTASNLVAHILNGRVALSISLTAFNSFLILFTIPLITSGAMKVFMQSDQEVPLSFWRTFWNIGFTVIFPVLIGLLMRNYFSGFADKLKPYLRFVLPGILLVVFLVVGLDSVGGESASSLGNKLVIAIPLLLLNIGTILIGYWIAAQFGINPDGRFTIAIEMGLQNSALAIFIGSQIIQNSQVVLVAIIYSSFSFFTTLGVGYGLSRRDKQP